MCMFRLTPDPKGDFTGPARLASRRTSHSRPSTASYRPRDSNPFRPARDYGIPMLTGPSTSNTYVPLEPRMPQAYTVMAPQATTNYTTVSPATSSGRQYEVVAPGVFQNVVRVQSAQAPYIIPDPTPNIPIPPPSPQIPIPAAPATMAAPQVPPQAPEPPSALQYRRRPAATAAASTSPPQAPPPQQTGFLNIQIPPRNQGHRRTGSNGNHSSNHSGSSRGRSGDRSTVHSGSSRQSNAHTSPPTTPRSGRSGKSGRPRQLEENREQPLNFGRPEERRERVEYVLENGRKIRRYYYD